MAKGGSFQNETAKRLSIWWTDGARDDVFRSTQGSGARFTVRKRKDKDTAFQGADLTFSDPVGEPLIAQWSIECKSGYSEGSAKQATKEQEKILTTAKNIFEVRGIPDPGIDKLLGRHTHNWCALDVLDSTKTKSLPTILEMWEQCTRDAEASGRRPMLIFRRLGKKPCVAILKHNMHYMIGFSGTPSEIDIPTITLRPQNILVMAFADFCKWANPIAIRREFILSKDKFRPSYYT